MTMIVLGQRFGKLIILSKTEKRIGKKVVWKCQCDCGNICFKTGNSLKVGDTKSCGCLIKEQRISLHKKLSGFKFGKLTVIEKTNKRDYTGNIIWKCNCECGNIVELSGRNLVSNHTKSCGCLQTEKAREGFSKDKNPNWQGGISNNPYPSSFNNKLKNFIRDRDKHRCCYPDCKYIEHKKKLCVHHIDGDKNNCNPNNLISLCNSHHNYIERNDPKSFVEYFNKLIYNENC